MGPWLEYGAMAVFLSSAPTVMTSSAEPGVPICAVSAEFPAAINIAIPSLTISFAARFTLSSSLLVHSINPNPPRLILAERMLYSNRLSLVHSMPAITVPKEPDPPASSTFTPTSLAPGAIPTCWKSGAPVPAVVPAQ